jgi:HK97 family phage prohead protease
MDCDFKALVERIQIDECDYASRLSVKGVGFKEAQSLFVKSINESKRQIEDVVSTGDIDRDEEIILPEAFKENLSIYLIYLANPVVISSHQHRLDTGHSSVVGQVVKAWIDAEGLHVIIWFAETNLGEEFWYLYKNKFQRAFSIGFIPLEWKDEDIEGGLIRTYTKVELLEISCVPVPANRNALSKSKQRKADFLAEKIAQREAKKAGRRMSDYLPKADAEIIAELKANGEWPSDEDCDKFGELTATITPYEIGNSDTAEPDYAQFVNSGPQKQELYQE